MHFWVSQYLNEDGKDKVNLLKLDLFDKDLDSEECGPSVNIQGVVLTTLFSENNNFLNEEATNVGPSTRRSRSYNDLPSHRAPDLLYVPSTEVSTRLTQ